MQRADQGFGAVGLVVLASVLADLLAVALPIVKADAVHLSEWLGFYGAIVGGSPNHRIGFVHNATRKARRAF